jgi:hypothetical protein
VSAGVYFFALAVALGLCVVAGLLAHRPKRPCPQCDEPVLMSVRRCRHCGYEFERGS